MAVSDSPPSLILRSAKPPAGRYSSLRQRTRVNEPELFPMQWRGFSGRPGFVDEMSARHPRVAKAKFDIMLGAQDADWAMSPVADETPVEADLRERLSAVLFDEMWTDSSQVVPSLRGSFESFIGAAASVLWYGATYFERSWVHDPTAKAGRGMRLEAYHVHQSTVRDYDEDAAGALRYIEQNTPDGSTRINAERLIAVRPWGAPGEWEGWTPVRSLGFMIELAWAMAYSTARHSKTAAGVLAVEATDESRAVENQDEIDRILDEFENGRTLSMQLPPGLKANFFAPPATGSHAVEIWKYVDGQVDHLLGSWVASLGLTAGSGSRALGEELAVQDAKRWARTLNAIGAQVSCVFPSLAAELGYPGVRVPMLQVREAEAVADVADLNAGAVAGISGGYFQPVPELTEEMANRYGFSDETVAALVEAQRQQVNAAREAMSARRETTGRDGDPVVDGDSQPLGQQTDTAIGDSLGVSRAAVGEARRERGIPPFDASDGCGSHGCGHTVDASDDGAAIVDHSGEPVEFFREFVDIEQVVDWNQFDRDRAREDARFESVMGQLRREQVEDLRAAVAGKTPGRTDDDFRRLLTAVEEEYGQRYATTIREYVQQVDRLTQQAGAAERSRAPMSPNAPDPAATDALRAFSEELAAARESSTQRQGMIAARRVQEDFLDQWEAMTAPESIVSAVTPRGLSQHGISIANRAESVGRLIGGVLGAEASGLVPVEAFRTSVRDRNRCAHCKRLDSGVSKKTWPLRTVEDVRAFIADPDATTPDPECDGGARRCRCGHLIRYARIR